MLDTEIDKIISKYENSSKYENRNSEMQYTERKQRRHENKEGRMVTFMNDSLTPLKEQSTAYRDSFDSILHQLDETERKLVISQRNYAQIVRKYEKLRQISQKLEQELEGQRKSRLQQLIDLRNKLSLLEKQNTKNITLIQAKDHTILILKEKLSQKQQETKLFQGELQQISKKLCTTIQSRQQQSLQFIHKQLFLHKQQAKNEKQQLKCKYQKHIGMLQKQNEKFQQILQQKQKQKRELLQNMEGLSKKYAQEMQEIRQALIKNEEQYRKWLDNDKVEKLKIIEKYEQEIREIRNSIFNSKLTQSDNSIIEIGKNKKILKEMEQNIINLQNSNNNKNEQIETMENSNKSYKIVISQLENQVKQLRKECAHLVNENKRLLMVIKEEENKVEKQRSKWGKMEVQMSRMRNNYEEVVMENQNVKGENLKLKQEMKRQLGSLLDVKKELYEATDKELNVNSSLMGVIAKLKSKNEELEKEVEAVTTQLYAERLEKGKAKDELEEVKVEMKKQYDLSMENTRRELQEQIQKTIQSRYGSDDIDKQKLYLNMFRLQRKYEMMKSEAVTVNEMLRLGTKMSKYYCSKDNR